MRATRGNESDEELLESDGETIDEINVYTGSTGVVQLTNSNPINSVVSVLIVYLISILPVLPNAYNATYLSASKLWSNIVQNKFAPLSEKNRFYQ